MNLTILSDLHIGASPATYRRTREAVARIIRHRSPDDTIVTVLGDLTEHGERAEYVLAIDALSPLIARGFKLLTVPGNHDYGPHGLRYCPDAAGLYRELFGDSIVYERGGHRFITLDTCYRPPIAATGLLGRIQQALTPSRRFANGEVGAAQLAALSAYLEDDMPTHILMHHHPVAITPGLRLVDAEEFWGVVDGQAASIHFGHMHRAGIYDRDGMMVRAHGSTGHQGYMTTMHLEGAV